ncbi:MAG TPA: Ku protein, partial [Bosea sp. (in: a-proteobacteria)]|nr:Ku protein [Bosea sp. (in: a-proteobacteria)]
KGLLLTTLRYDKTVRQPDEVFDGLRKGKLDPELVDLATHIIEKKQARFDPSGFEDRYEEALLALIEAKRKGKKPPVAKPAERPTNVVNLFEALKKSLGEEEAAPRKSASGGKKPASGKPAKKAVAAKTRKSA